MAQITWRNVNAPEFSSANSLFDAGASRLQDSLTGLQDIAKAGNVIQQENWDMGSKMNTMELVSQLNNATTTEELNAVDTKQFGAQIDTLKIAEAQRQRKDFFMQQAQKEQELQYKYDELNQLKLHDDKNGGLHSFNPYTGKRALIGTYQVKSKYGSRGKSGEGMTGEQEGILQEIRDNMSSYGDKEAYLSMASATIQKTGKFTSKELGRELDYISKEYDKIHLLPQEALYQITAQDRYKQEALTQVEATISQIEEMTNAALKDGASLSMMKLATDTSLDTDETAAKYANIGNTGVTGASIVAELTRLGNGKRPTGREVEYLAGLFAERTSKSAPGDMILKHDEVLRELAVRYHKAKTNPDNMLMAQRFRNDALKMRTDVTSSADSAKQALTEQLRMENQRIIKGVKDARFTRVASHIDVKKVTSPYLRSAEAILRLAHDKSKDTGKDVETVTGSNDIGSNKFGKTPMSKIPPPKIPGFGPQPNSYLPFHLLPEYEQQRKREWDAFNGVNKTGLDPAILNQHRREQPWLFDKNGKQIF